MKIPLKHISRYLEFEVDIQDISSKLFQLGHEHEIEGNSFNMEFTPNRGDCLSLKGILRDLSIFFDIDLNVEKYSKNIKKFNLNFENQFVQGCPNISFLKIEIDKTTFKYNGVLKDYFDNKENKKNNFFTDVSNYISYETGQPTHCYDSSKMNGRLEFKLLKGRHEFVTLLGDKINLADENAVFTLDNKIINLAGIMGGQDTCCSKNTTSVIVECGYFPPELIINKSVKYSIKSDAAYKFERGVDPKSHEDVVRRFIEIISQNTSIKNLELYTQNNLKNCSKCVDLDANMLNKIIGIDLTISEYQKIFKKLSFKVNNNKIEIPSYRSDIESQNDLAEEISRVIGYDNLPISPIKISRNKNYKKDCKEKKIKSFLIDNGFYEVINFPFSKDKSDIEIDNPLDKNKSFYRNKLRESLVNNLLYNERRQKDSIKLFEISDLYSFSEKIVKDKYIGIIASGRLGKDYINFSKKINKKSIDQIFQTVLSNKCEFEEISRNDLDTKSKDPIIYLECKLEDFLEDSINCSDNLYPSKSFVQYKPISEFPCSVRDLSFSIKNYLMFEELQKIIFSVKSNLIKEIVLFDFYNDIKNDIVKIGFRFIFQSSNTTITDKEVDSVMNDLIKASLLIDGVEIPGINK